MKDDLNFLINFIKEVESHPCIYDCCNIDYVNKRATDIAWAEIANKLDENPAECKSKWRSTRSSYIRSLHPTKDGPKKEYYLAPYLTFLNPFIRFRQEDDNSNISSPNQSIEVCYVNDGTIKSNMKIEPGLEEDEDVEEDHESENEHTIGLKIQQPISNTSTNGSVHRKKIKRHSKKNYSLYEAENSVVENINIEKTESEPNREDAYEFYVKSLLPHLRSMTERQYFAFQRGVIDLIENIKYSESS